MPFSLCNIQAYQSLQFYKLYPLKDIRDRLEYNQYYCNLAAGVVLKEVSQGVRRGVGGTNIFGLWEDARRPSLSPSMQYQNMEVPPS